MDTVPTTMRLPLSLLAVSFLLLPAAGVAQRLPANVRPEHYTLNMTPDIAAATFHGTETIDVVLTEPAATVTLNALELEIQSATAKGQGSTESQAAQVGFDPAKEQVTLTFAHPLPAGRSALSFAFTGILNDKLRGFYLSRTKARNYAVTQFESTDARRAFPSFDEPALKATFDVSLTVDKRDTAISNGPVISDKPAADGRHTLTFATTPKMSTYLVAFLVGDFQCSKGKSDGVPIRVCSTPDKVALTKFAVQASEHFLHYYDTYFGIKYPMRKLDLIAIPDFEAGAMENFGAITYRETDLLVDEKKASSASLGRVAVVVAHEMAHQWFGDMVTMQWWDNLWLNEGFATWMQSKAVNDWKPEWKVPQAVAESLDGTLNYDAGHITRTIRARAETPAEIAQMFDGIAYGKAGAVLGMVEHWLGPKVFEHGVHNYLAAHLYANATAEDFWNAQTANAHQPVDTVMASFVDRPGVPLLRFEDRQAAGFPVTQQRFYLAGPVGDEREVAQVSPGWTLPVCLKTAAGEQCQVLPPTAAALAPAGSAALPFFYANAGGTGYYRVAYSPAQVKAINAVAESALTVPERVGYLGDRWALTRSGQGSVGEYLDLALALRTDPNASVLGSILSSLAAIRTRIATDADRDRMDALVRTQFGPIYTALGAPETNEPLDRRNARMELFGALGEAGDPAVLAQAKTIAEALFAGARPQDSGTLDTSVALMAENGDTALYDRLLTLSQSSTDPGLAIESQQMLARFHRPELVVRTLEYATSGKVRNQDSWVLIAVELGQRATQAVAWDWVRAHWELVGAQLTTASGGNVVASTGAFCTRERREEVAGFFAAHPVPASDRSLAKALDSIDACVQLRTSQQQALTAWLQEQVR